MHFQIETTSFCDLTCQECPNHQMKRNRKMMGLEMFAKILHSYVLPFKHLHWEGNSGIILNKDGEPLLNKHLSTMLGYIRDAERSLRISLYTHGLLLTRPFIEFLGSLGNHVDLLVSYHFYNHDGSQNDYSRLTKLLKDMLPAWPPSVALILASHLVRPMTAERLQEWKAQWDGYPITVHANVQINPWTGLIDEGVVSEGSHLKRFEGCPYERFSHMFFGATGNVVACCMDLEEEIVFGNVMVDDPQDMLNKVESFYARQRNRDVQYGVCHDCFGLPKLVQLGV